MLASGLLDANKVGDVDAVIEKASYRQFYMHGTGHWIGRDVHDVGDYLSAGEAPVEQPDGMGGKVVKKPSRLLQPGMVVTIEPGVYLRGDVGVRTEVNVYIAEREVVVTPKDFQQSLLVV